MKRVYVLRHAKSSWDDPSRPDHDRPLAGRGRRAAKAMRRHLRDADVDPQLVLCSTARRARETLERVEDAFGDRTTRVEEGLYMAGADDLLARLRRVDDRCDTVLLIGHNPGLQELVLLLAAEGGERDRVAAKFPTAALATLAVDVPRWRDLAPGGARLEAFVRPRDLASAP